MKHVYIYLSLLFLLISCSQYDNMPDIQSPASSTSQSFSLEEALEMANSYMDQIQGCTRAEKTSRKAKITPVTQTKTRGSIGDSNLPDTLLYLINYEDDGGFVLMGANKKIERLLAISDEGHLDLNDTVYNKGLSNFINNTLSSPVTFDSIGSMQINLTCKPKLNSRVSRWGQQYPYNTHTPLVDSSNHGAVGCLPLAMGMIASYFEYPKNYGDNQTIDWYSAKMGYSDDKIAQLLAFIGKELHTKYELIQSGSYSLLMKNAFSSLSYNYNNTHYYITSFNPAIALINYRKPLIAMGESRNGEHAWVIDGSLQATYDPEAYIGIDPPAPKTYLHCVWGWFGSGNGYYLYDKLGNLGGVRNDTHPSDGVFPGYPDHNTVDIFEDVTVTHEYFPIYE